MRARRTWRSLLHAIGLLVIASGSAFAQVQQPKAVGAGGAGGGTVAQGTAAATTDTASWPIKIVFGSVQIDPRDVSDRTGRLLGHVTFDNSSLAVTQSGTWSVSFTAPQHVVIDSSASLAVTGPLTDAQLRASAVPVSGTFWQSTQPISASSLPLPSNAAQETGGNLATIATNTATIGSTVGTDGGAAPAYAQVIAGLDTGDRVRPATVDAMGSLVVALSAMSTRLPLQPCNAVRRTNCAPKGY